MFQVAMKKVRQKNVNFRSGGMKLDVLGESFGCLQVKHVKRCTCAVFLFAPFEPSFEPLAARARSPADVP